MQCSPDRSRCCAAVTLLADTLHLDKGSAATLVEVAQYVSIMYLLRNLCRRHGLVKLPPWYPRCIPLLCFRVLPCQR